MQLQSCIVNFEFIARLSIRSLFSSLILECLFWLVTFSIGFQSNFKMEIIFHGCASLLCAAYSLKPSLGTDKS